MTLDYQVTPTLSEEMMLEFLALRSRPGFFKRIRLPLLLAFAGAFIAASGTPLVRMRGEGHEYRTFELVSSAVLGAVIGFGIGWGGIRIIRANVRSAFASRIRTGAAVGFAARTFSWDETGVSITSPVWRYEWKWTAVDAIWDGPLGVHFLWRGQLLFNVTKHALPMDAQPEKLREILRRFSPPMLLNNTQPTRVGSLVT